MLEALLLEARAVRLSAPLPELDRGRLGPALARRLLRHLPHAGARTAQEIAESVLSADKTRLDGLMVLAERLIRWNGGGRPVVAASPELRTVRCLVDEDLLLATRVVAAGKGRMSPASINPWHLATDPAPDLDGDIADLLEKPLAETHLHLWGAAPPFVDWLPLMLDLVSVAHKAQILAKAMVEEEEALPGTEQEVAQVWIEDLAEAAVLRIWLASTVRDLSHTGSAHPFRHVKGLLDWRTILFPPRRPENVRREDRIRRLLETLRGALAAIGYKRPQDPESVAIAGCPVWMDPGGVCPYRDPLAQAVLLDMEPGAPREAVALGERYLLAGALAAVRDPLLEEREMVREELQERLLRYIQIKTSFQGLLLHHAGPRGLDRFRSIFSRRDNHWRGGNHRARRVWSLATERYWTQQACLRWLQASTELPLLPGRHADGRVERDLELARSATRAHLPDLERKLELRVSPSIGPAFGQRLHAQAQGICDALQVLARWNRSLPRFQTAFLFHLRKDKRAEPEVHAQTIRQIIRWLLDHPAYRPLVVGLDAASSELDEPPADFVAALRDEVESLTVPADTFQAPLRLGRTFHVGEDFRDLLTGLRQVDLVQRLLRYGSGDRMGHALALGVEPHLWYRHGEASFVLLGDHLLDLLWADLVVEETAPQRQDLIGFLHQRLSGLKLRDLEEACFWFRAWLKPESKQERESAFQERILLQQLPLRARNTLHEIRIDEHWITVVSEVQKLVVRRVEKAGIAVEANPTSNLVVAGLGKLEELPVFRQHPIRRGESGLGPPLRISISTDDPGIFQTGLREEFNYLASTALASKDYSRGEVLEWLDRLRQIGYDSSFIKGRAWSGERFLEYLCQLREAGGASRDG